MEIITRNLNNVPIKIINTNKFKIVNIEMFFTRKLDYKDIGPYNLLVSMLVTRNAKYPSISSFSSYKENNYGLSVNGSFSSRGDISLFNFRVSSINSKFSLNEDLFKVQIDTIKECLYSPLLTEEALSEVKDIYISKLKDKLNKKTYILKKKINEVLGNETPYGVEIESNIDDISNVTLDDIKRVYDKLFTSKCYIYVIGQVEENRVLDEFSFLKIEDNNDALDYSYLKSINEGRYEYESKFLQSAISLIYECNIVNNDPLFFALRVFVEMLNYDLFNIIREKYNYCYYIYALSNNYLNTIEIVSEIESKNFEDVIRITNEIIDSYKEDKSSDFLITKNKIINLIKSNQDNSRDLALVSFGFDFNNIVSSSEELISKYEEVTYDDVKKVSEMLTLKMSSILKEANHE